jgi:hypothetical protein
MTATTAMTNQITKEQLIRVKILPQLKRVSDKLWENGQGRGAICQKIDKITEELINILNDEDT